MDAYYPDRIKLLENEVRQELSITANSPEDARVKFDTIAIRWKRIWPDLVVESELFLVDRTAGTLLQIPLPPSKQSVGAYK